MSINSPLSTNNSRGFQNTQSNMFWQSHKKLKWEAKHNVKKRKFFGQKMWRQNCNAQFPLWSWKDFLSWMESLAAPLRLPLWWKCLLKCNLHSPLLSARSRSLMWTWNLRIIARWLLFRLVWELHMLMLMILMMMIFLFFRRAAIFDRSFVYNWKISI